ncbi:hypothetical protein CEXT_527351 [Caerostris extrusa]|uniref:Uncharacterized protein n=1 Tax=Caerostris extrusa TaxID=172846 RepID=A0AAV4MG97_CAEEX|nr:hypothetical protein CEXT_527351 [Caerostris extrusa]
MEDCKMLASVTIFMSLSRCCRMFLLLIPEVLNQYPQSGLLALYSPFGALYCPFGAFYYSFGAFYYSFGALYYPFGALYCPFGENSSKRTIGP